MSASVLLVRLRWKGLGVKVRSALRICLISGVFRSLAARRWLAFTALYITGIVRRHSDHNGMVRLYMECHVIYRFDLSSQIGRYCSLHLVSIVKHYRKAVVTLIVGTAATHPFITKFKDRPRVKKIIAQEAFNSGI